MRLAATLLAATALSAVATAAPITVLERNGAYVAVEAYGPNVIHVTIATDRKEAEAGPGYGILAAHADHVAFKQTSDAASDSFASPALKLTIPAEKTHVRGVMENYFVPELPAVRVLVANAAGKTIFAMTGWEMAPYEVTGEETFQTGIRFAAAPDEHFYGLGQNQDGILDLKGRTISCKHWYDAPTGETVCVPFLYSSKGYAIVWDNPSETTVSAGIHGSTHITSKVGERVSFFVLTGTPQDIYSGYARLTGKTPIPPKAAFGLIQSKARYASQEEVLGVANTYRAKKYPLDVMVVDWFYWTHMGQLDIDPAQFPDPDAMNKALHGMGMQSIISIWPRFEKAGRYFAELDQKGYLLKDKDGKTQDGLPFRADRTGGLIDSTNPEARKWYWEHIRDNILSHGFDYPWLDETEPDLVPDGHRFAIGSGDRFHNLYPLVHVEGVADGMRAWKPDSRVLILSRAAYLGSQRTGALFWSSDIPSTWEALSRQIPTGLNMTASGIAYWGNDIGGWQDLAQTTSVTRAPLVNPAGGEAVVGQNHDYPELFVRWFEYGTFLPTLRIHGSRKHTEIWALGPAAEKILARYDRLRYQLVPYLYACAKTVYDTGVPFMRPLWMDFPSDPNVANLGSEYLFGPAFLVAPVTAQGQTTARVYLPSGTDWYDFWTGKKEKGGHWITVAAPADRIPVFVRAGSIVPLGSDVQSTAEKQTIAKIKIYPGANASFTLYDDDGKTYAYEKGEGVKLTTLTWNDKTKKLTGSNAPVEVVRK
jgi:alpha-D-xyloside xylohydrolase